MVLAEDAETGKPIEWVEIDPEAFTGAQFTIYYSQTHIFEISRNNTFIQ